MRAKAYLGQVFQRNRILQANLVELKQLRQLAVSIGAIDYGKVGGVGSEARPIEDAIGRICVLETKIQGEAACFLALKEEIRGHIEGLDDLERVVMQRRYLCLETWEDVAEGVGVSLRHVFRVHGAALIKLDKKFSECH